MLYSFKPREPCFVNSDRGGAKLGEGVATQTVSVPMDEVRPVAESGGALVSSVAAQAGLYGSAPFTGSFPVSGKAWLADRLSLLNPNFSLLVLVIAPIGIVMVKLDARDCDSWWPGRVISNADYDGGCA